MCSRRPAIRRPPGSGKHHGQIRYRPGLITLLLLTAAGPGLPAADVFSEMVRSTPWLSPADALKSFVVPAGFAMQLVAAEPDLGKPVSMSFDAAGRLWVAETNAYPIETSADQKPRDVIRILSGFTAEGRAAKNERFAGGLSMPDAVAPYRNGAIVFTIPDIVRLQDTDGDGKADQRDVVLGPFAVKDTHNLANNFRRGFDGWMYGGQGVGNQSALQGRDGREFRMGGGTFRFRPDGSTIEKFGDGQANVFGLCFDPLGNLFTSDCHSMPIHQNIYGGFYPVFGKPHDGLGYAPQMLQHLHGSTAISGLIPCEEPIWPAEFQGNFFLGNVVTSRINRDRIEEYGSTRLAVEMPDLVSSRDPWFRPVDVQFGPDGALYIADFYNRIIAHVEVPLDHPGRDRSSGRIWRVVRLGADGKPLLRVRPDFMKLSVAEKVSRLGDPSMAHRLAVLNFLADQGGDAVIGAVRQAMADPRADLHLKAAALWILERLGVLTDAELGSTLKDPDRLLRTHAVRILVERSHWKPGALEWVYHALEDADGCVARAAADALARHPSLDHILPLLALRHRAPAADTHLVYQARKALRDQLLLDGGFAFLANQKLTGADARAICDVAPALPSAGAAAFLADFLTKLPSGGNPPPDWVRHITRYGDPPALESLAKTLTAAPLFEPAIGLALLEAALQGSGQRGMKLPGPLIGWVSQLARQWLEITPPPPPAALIAAANLAANLPLAALEKPLSSIARSASGDLEARTACLRALLSINPAGHLREAEKFLNDASLAMERRGEVAQSLAGLNSGEARTILTQCLREAPERFALLIATALCGSGDGADALFQAVSGGQAPASLLAAQAIRDRLLALRPLLATPVARLTAAISPNAQRLQKIVLEREAAFPGAGASATEGARIFQVHCAVCHSLGAKGGRIGPELDGIGHRGLERLCEDVIDPNRNVDRVFRYSIVTLKDGTVMTGLFRREEGAQLVFTDATGKDIMVEKTTVAHRMETETSLMPEIFADLLPPADFQNLLAFLLAQSTRP